MAQNPKATGIKFYYMPESPPCRTVEMVAAAANLDLVKQYVNLFTKEHLQPEFVKLNPWQKIPFIVDGDLKMNESRAIAAYLVNKYLPDDNTLYPRDPTKRAQVDELLYLDMSISNQASKLFYPKVFGVSKTLDPETERVYRQNLKYLDDRLQSNGGKKFMLDDNLTIADISISASFTLVEACGYDTSEFTALTNYLVRLKDSIPKYREINVNPTETMKNYINQVQEKLESNDAQ